ncbi:MAG: retinoic acid inducible I [Trebouxia sp. A1-2]|nr:MAG: retinoic acid inducible I [Trebouxia sp. A1-2]
MAQRAPVLTLERQSLRSALDPGQYHHLFQADYLELARLADPDIFLRTLDVDDATQKGECEHILSAQAVDPRCTAVISIVLECRGQDGSKKRRRMLSELTAHFPTQNQQGRKINQGPGGDLSFLPATHPLICKQSCKYTLLGHDGEWSSKREFASHKVFSVTHSLVPARVATISDIQPKDTTGILFTTTQPHDFKSKRTCGQLFASGEQTPSVPAAFLQTAFKVAAVPSPLQFIIQSPIKGLQEEKQLAQLAMHLQAGVLHLTFGQCPAQGMGCLGLGMPLGACPRGMPLGLGGMPPSHAAPSSMPPVQRQLEYSQNLPQAVSDLTVGPSSLPGQEPAFRVLGSAKVSETLTATHIHVMSDERLKTNISLSEFDALSALDKVGIFQYQMSNDPDSQHQIGVTAQNLRAALPDTVELDPAAGLLSIKLDKLVIYTLKGVQEAAKALRELDTRQRLGMHMLMQLQSAQNASQNSEAGSFSAAAVDSESDSDSDMSAADAFGLDQVDTSMLPDPASIHYTSFTDDSALVQHMMAQLGETNPGLPIKVAKLLQQLGHQTTWDAFLEAQTTAVLARDGTARQTEKQAVDRTNSALHGYQQQLVDCVSKGQNHIIVAPTGSGKTRVAVEVAGLLFQRKPSARILFLTATVALAEQQTGVFRAAKCIPDGVACFSSKNPISGRQWPSAIKDNHVLVMTVQALLNMLEDGDATLQAFDLMVFDECHHTQNNHPFNKVALKYRQLTHQQQSCLQAQTYALQDRLQKNMCASYLIISADHAEVRQVVGETQESTRLVATRSEDVTFAMNLGTVLLDHLTQLTELDSMILMGADALAEITSSLRDGKWSARLKHWLTTQAATVPQTPTHLRAHLALLQDCNTALSLLKDTGFELALHYLANKCVANQQPANQHSTTEKHVTTNTDQAASAHAAEFRASKALVSEAAAASLSQALIQDLSEKVSHLQLALDALAVTQAGTNISFPKFRELVTVLTEMQGKKSAWHGIVFVKERQSVHAIVSMLRNVPQMATISFHAFTGRATNSKRRLDPLLSSNPRVDFAAPNQSLGSRRSGMKLREQKNALSQFRQAEGMSVLVATAAAEEGLDITNCELVVCYTVVETGREMMQKRGRARMPGSEFVCIVEEHDQRRVEHARMAESNARVAQLHVSHSCEEAAYLFQMQHSQVCQAVGNICMVRPSRRLINAQGTLIQGLRLGKLQALVVQDGYVGADDEEAAAGAGPGGGPVPCGPPISLSSCSLIFGLRSSGKSRVYSPEKLPE